MEVQTYLAQLKALLDIEKEADARQYRETVLNRSRPDRVQKGLSWYPVELRRVQVGLGERISVELHRTGGPENSAFQVGTVVSLFGVLSDQEVGRYTGVVSALRDPMMRIALGTTSLADWVPSARLGVDLEFDDRTYQEMQKALQAVQQAGGESRLRDLREVLRGGQAPAFRDWEGQYAHPQLNASQNQAVQRVLEARDVAVIHGPPGTGKTTTLVAAIREVLHHEHQVLVCAPSNTAVDLLTLRCSELGLDVVRLGNPARVDDALQAHTLDGAVTRHADYEALRKLRKDADKIRRQALKYKRSFGGKEAARRRELLKEARELGHLAHKLEDYILHQVLSQSQVIAATLTGAAGSILGGRRFHTLFIDEAAQALEPACWIPILRADRVIMAGDHCQLPPTVKSIEAERAGLGKTLFEHVIEAVEPGVMLDQQYRMNQHIMAFSAQQFYAGRLRADASVADHRLGPDFAPLEFVDTAGCGFEETKHPETLSTGNPEEAQLLLRHLALLFNQIEREAPSLLEGDFQVGIIAPYKYQVRILRDQVRDSPMLDAYARYISVNTVDGFQGQERDVIYISLVRANPKGEIGFLGDTRRMNVALTRARFKLVVVGDSATLGEHPFYQDFLQYAEASGAYRSAWEYLTG